MRITAVCRTALGIFAGVASLLTHSETLQAQVTVDLPLGVGFQVPSYDRVNGLSLPYGPSVVFGDNRLTLAPTVTYRSHLGNFDPSLEVTWAVADTGLVLSLTGARGTFTNDRWIRSDLINSVGVIVAGVDTRNYYRADRTEGRLTYTKPWEAGQLVAFVGGRFENGWSTGWRAGEHGGLYSFIDRNDPVNGADRPNPLIDEGHIASALVGVGGHLGNERVQSKLGVNAELAWHTPLGNHFQQYTLYEEGTLHTFAGQRFEFDAHGVTTAGGTTPRQRYAYIGGSGTLATIDLLSLGGDRMYFADVLYIVPIPKLTLPLVGAVFVAPHYAIGAAGVGQFGVPTANIGGRVGAGPIRVDYLVNPRTHDDAFQVGFSFSR